MTDMLFFYKTCLSLHMHGTFLNMTLTEVSYKTGLSLHLPGTLLNMTLTKVS